jgi:hypothetical protein
LGQLFDETTGKYEGLAYGRLAPPSLSPQGLLVRKDIAAAQVRDVPPVTGEVALRPGETGEQPGLATPPDLPDKQTPHRFYGLVEIDPASRPIKAFETILNAVVMELQRGQGAKMQLTLEIEAESPAGFPDTDVSVVRDNAKQLKFKAESTGFGD